VVTYSRVLNVCKKKRLAKIRHPIFPWKVLGATWSHGGLYYPLDVAHTNWFYMIIDVAKAIVVIKSIMMCLVKSYVHIDPLDLWNQHNPIFIFKGMFISSVESLYPTHLFAIFWCILYTLPRQLCQIWVILNQLRRVISWLHVIVLRWDCMK
jgi:hypothetical protein